MSSNVLIRAEVPTDVEAIHRVHEAAFENSAEANLVDALCQGGFARVSLVACVNEQVVGHVLFSHLDIVAEHAESRTPALSLAPVAVLPHWQRRGVGSQLIRSGLEQALASGYRIVIVLGEPAYYERLGFAHALAKPLQCVYACEAFMALELEPGALAGVTGEVRYAPPFADLG